MRRLLPLLLLLLPAGCGFLIGQGVGQGIDAAKRASDSPTQVAFKAAPETVYAAARAAVDDLGFEFVKAKYDEKSLDGEVVSRTAQGTAITATVRGASPVLTRLSLRAGTFGDGPLQAEVLKAIQARVGQKPPETP